jgi:hypothetical protein
MEWGDRKFADLIGSANCELVQSEGKGEGAFTWEGRCKRAFVPSLKTRGASDRQRTGALGDETRVEHEERDAAKVVGVEVGEQDEIDAAAVDPAPLQRNQRRGAAVNQK